LSGAAIRAATVADDAARLAEFIGARAALLVLTGAGCSAPSGIPTYRDHAGGWAHPQPVQYGDFIGSETARRRYWARSFRGWPRVAAAQPNAAHRALAGLEESARLRCTITQNVDGLHRAAGARAVIELHGRLDRVRCLACNGEELRASVQERLASLNPDWRPGPGTTAPDGDAGVEAAPDQFRIADCRDCGGVLKPDVVFFGESVPRPVADSAFEALAASDALLVVGSSLMVYSGFRFARAAAAAGKPVATLNLGRTRADELLSLKITADCVSVLPAALALLDLARR
jgi:NAD-dependent SIR2 family protein deacetylase